MRKVVVMFAVGVGVTVLGFGHALAAPKTSNPGVSVTFGDRAGDAIVSDGHGPYVNGSGGVVGEIYDTGSGDMTLNLSQTRPNRSFNGTYTPASDVAQPGPTPPSGSFRDGWFINIHDVWSVPVYATVSTDASFSAGAGDFRWCGDGSSSQPQWCQSIGSEQVTVTRSAFDTWTVVANPGSDLNLLVQSIHGKNQISGYYHMPFALTIKCSNSMCQ